VRVAPTFVQKMLHSKTLRRTAQSTGLLDRRPESRIWSAIHMEVAATHDQECSN